MCCCVGGVGCVVGGEVVCFGIVAAEGEENVVDELVEGEGSWGIDSVELCEDFELVFFEDEDREDHDDRSSHCAASDLLEKFAFLLDDYVVKNEGEEA